MLTDSPISDHLALVHASVAGRARFEVAGLYRSDQVKQRIENALNNVTGVNRIKANVLTGRLLVIYQPDVSMDDIVAVIEKHLHDIGKLCSRPKQAEKFNTDKIKQVFGTASGVFYRIFIALTGKYKSGQQWPR